MLPLSLNPPDRQIDRGTPPRAFPRLPFRLRTKAVTPMAHIWLHGNGSETVRGEDPALVLARTEALTRAEALC